MEIGFKGVREGNAQQKGEGMTYWEKWRVEIENIGVEFNGKKTENIDQAATIITVGKDGIPRICRYDCANCIFRGLIGGIGCVWNAKEWLKSEAESEEKRMTNREKNKKRFDELGLGDLPASEIARHIAVRKNGDVDLCSLILCHDCIFTCRHCVEEAEEWLTDEAEPDKTAPEEKEKMKKEEIKVGDTVRVTEKGYAKEGEIGLVTGIFNISADGVKTYGVRLDGDFSERVFFENGLEKVKTKKTPPCIVVYRDGDTVTVKDLETGEEASAVCSKKDTFDIHTGAFIAMSRLTHFDTDIRLMRLEWEQIESYVSDIKMRFGALMGKGYKYPDFDEEEKAK